MRNALTLSAEIRAALADGMPVVALESTVIAHGLPHPDNLETSQAMEQAVRDTGAIP
ncbi:MAG TPA: pseudouridine-5-phosphate glycosidase, partial [Rhodospirillaceae bacterium]|nr:pseudouridine-5-phosphate glycosidase [Rhodospirillaceae bacterium]